MDRSGRLRDAQEGAAEIALGRLVLAQIIVSGAMSTGPGHGAAPQRRLERLVGIVQPGATRGRKPVLVGSALVGSALAQCSIRSGRPGSAFGTPPAPVRPRLTPRTD